MTSSDRDNLISAQIEKIDSVLEEWSQGDCTIGDYYFVSRFNPLCPLTNGSQDIVDRTGIETDLIESPVRGFVVVTQTCDIVRSCADRPYLEVSPLVEVNAENLEQIKRLNRPNYAYIAGVSDRHLVADLDRVMTVEKSVVLTWERIQGCQSDADTRSLGEALARKRSRFAFPDDFTKLVSKLTEKIKKKHDKDSPEGIFLQALREIRVQAAPSWGDPEVKLFFWFIRNDKCDIWTLHQESKLINSWLEALPTSKQFISVAGLVTFLDDMKARNYVESDRLDLDRLSKRD